MAQIVAAAPRPGIRHGQLDEQLLRSQHRAPDAGEERRDRHPALTLGPDDHRLGVERQQRRSHVRRRRRVTEIATERGQIAHLHGAHEGPAFGQREVVSADSPVELEHAGRHRGADTDPLAVSRLDGAQPRDARQIDHAGRLEQAVLHLWQEVGASGQQLRLRPALGQGFDTVLYALRKDELESSHARSPRRFVV